MLTIGESDKRDDVRDGMKERGEDGDENNQSLTAPAALIITIIQVLVTLL